MWRCCGLVLGVFVGFDSLEIWVAPSYTRYCIMKLPKTRSRPWKPAAVGCRMLVLICSWWGVNAGEHKEVSSILNWTWSLCYIFQDHHDSALTCLRKVGTLTPHSDTDQDPVIQDTSWCWLRLHNSGWTALKTGELSSVTQASTDPVRPRTLSQTCFRHTLRQHHLSWCGVTSRDHTGGDWSDVARPGPGSPRSGSTQRAWLAHHWLASIRSLLTAFRQLMGDTDRHWSLTDSGHIFIIIISGVSHWTSDSSWQLSCICSVWSQQWSPVSAAVWLLLFWKCPWLEKVSLCSWWVWDCDM